MYKPYIIDSAFATGANKDSKHIAKVGGRAPVTPRLSVVDGTFRNKINYVCVYQVFT